MDISIINNTASQGTHLGKLLEKHHNIKYFNINNSNFRARPNNSINIGKSPIPYSRTLKKRFYKFRYKSDLQILNAIPDEYTQSKKTIIWWHGSDIRENIYSPDNYNVSQQYVSTPDLLRISPKLKQLNRIIDLEHFKPTGEKNPNRKEKLVFGVFSTQNEAKNIPRIYRILNKLKQKYNITIISNKKGKIAYDIMPSIIETCDIIVDQYRTDIGAIGAIGLEALAMNRPVLGYFREDGVESQELWNYVIPIVDDKIDLNEYKPINSRSYVIREHNGNKTIKTLKEDGFI